MPTDDDYRAMVGLRPTGVHKIATDARLDNNGLWTDQKTAMTLAFGDRIDPLNPDVNDIHIADIARSLSRQCRYNGHVGGFLSVARHSLWVSRRIKDTHGSVGMQLHGLLHDAAEAYLGDMIRPLKHGPTIGKAYLEAESKLENVISLRFDLEYPWPEYITEADTWVLLEMEMAGECRRWSWNTTPEQDERTFLEYYNVLIAQRKASQ